MQSFRTIVSLQLIIFDLYCQATCAAALNYIMKAVLGENLRFCYLGKVKATLGSFLDLFWFQSCMCIFLCV